MSTVNPMTVASLPHGNRTIVLWAIAGITVLAICLPLEWFGYAALFAVVLSVVLYVSAATLTGQVENLVIGWIMVFPLGYYFLSYPREQPLMTLDRAVIGVLLLAVGLGGARVVSAIPSTMRLSAGLWAAFLFFAAITIPRVKNPLNSSRLLVEGFLFPAILAWYVLRYFDVRRYLRGLHVATCIMVIYVGSIGAAEIVLQRDLLSLPEKSGILLAGDYDKKASEILVRPNGPFSSTNSFAMVGMVSLFFLFFLKRAMAKNLPAWQALLHRVGVAAALGTTLMPLFRSMMTSLLVILLIDAAYSRGMRRAIRVGAVGACLLVALVASRALPEVFEERSRPDNLYGRIAQQGQTMALFLDYPINGAGLNNYHEAVQASSKYSIYYQDIESVDSPHNNFGAVLAETGITGFLPFFVSQILLFAAFFKIRGAKTADATLVWRMSLYILLGYWINGLSLTTAYFWDLNIWYMLVLAVLYKYAITQAPASQTLVRA
ncbi:MAG: hypothetical protein DMG73_19270 [Acidobacteria bacterium]|nr:MAG: hypothetical protein DMG73_19270 [Acidobacteriota bacterium]PYX67130.1 MAG: hypothetical protein DMG74_01325 [Acidobacteriota bacterium]